MTEKSRYFKKDIFDDNDYEDQDKIEQKQFFGIDLKQAFLDQHFNEDQIQKMKLLDQEYRLQTEDINSVRRKLGQQNRRIQLACTMKLYSQATETDQDIQDEIVEIGEKCPIILQSYKDNNTFYRSFMIQFLFKLVFNEKDDKACNKSIFKFIKKIQSIEKFDCVYPLQFHQFKDNELKCFLISFILKMYILKLADNLASLEKIIKMYNEMPEVDTASIIICKNLLSITFTQLVTHDTYRFLLENNQIITVPQILAQFDESENQTIIGVFVEVFQCNLIILNDERAEQPEYYVPQTSKTINDDIYIYKASDKSYHSIFETKYAQQYLTFCSKEGYLYQQDLKDLVQKLHQANIKLSEHNDEENFKGQKEQKKWDERVFEMEKKNKQMKDKSEDFFPVIQCCECDRELSDFVPLLKFDNYYFCEGCILDMIAQLNREDKQFINIGSTQVKRYQLRDAITELNNEREKTSQLQSMQKEKKKNKGIGDKSELVSMHLTNNSSQQTEKKWQNLQKICVRCNDDKCYQQELYLVKEVKTQRQIALCMSCLVFLYDQVKYTFRNISLHKSFELSNEEIKNTYKDFSMYHLEKTKYTCTMCLKIRLNNYIIQPLTKVKELKIICKQCFITIFQYDEKLQALGISDILKEQILDQLFQQDFELNICVSCDKPDLKTFNIENITQYPSSLKQNNINFDSNNVYHTMTSIKKESQNQSKKELKDILIEGYSKKPSSNSLNQDEESLADENSNRRLSKICIDCIFLNIGKCKNPYMDYLITYSKLHTNIVYKYNNQIKTLLENDARLKMQQILNTCTMCFRKLKDLHEMNDKGQRICTSCFVQYKKEFKLNQGEFEGYHCDQKHQDIILGSILAYLVDITQCIGCSEKIKTFDYEALKIQNSFSNVIVCDNCIREQLVQANQDLRNPYEIKSQYLNEVLILQNKKEVNEKIKQFSFQMQINNEANQTEAEKQEGAADQSQEKKLFQRKQNKEMPNKNKQHLTSRNYNLRCFNRSCKEVELCKKQKIELQFVKMPKCQCLFCIHCLTAFYMKLSDANSQKQQIQQKQSQIKSKIEVARTGDNYGSIKKEENQNVEDGDQVERYCPSMLCNEKYSEYQIRDLVNGYEIQVNGQENEDEEFQKKLNEALLEENKKKYVNERVFCSVCKKENLLVVQINDDFLVNYRKEKEKEQNKNQKGFKMLENNIFGSNEKDELSKIEGECECFYSCKPCLFQTYYKDRCSRCLKKAPYTVYKLLFNFKDNMKCSQCQHNKFITLEDGPLMYRTDTKFQCTNCKTKFKIN
ncbi:hypothetical protein TTHERM_00008780 (macronuclear) [Tetrahymena thermophila SB210]|uniref:Uncharacterized protein n=1 Tax=Tetrahymena thermophila (strain SB210) TaxID=312017 RepID=Q22S56_TETTS|nr:hypothetical protein TTHERM_00008780 [Tetrahymena thermophila SB210]EAR87916.2 hypothetical protein TTHERM_00008780 [Tetrahymena thermophila SB210]|eukprot:XP_001008161.2 hypothetical protein TTHERM_00008780 [Tetrahymena thermophila SB210]